MASVAARPGQAGNWLSDDQGEPLVTLPRRAFERLLDLACADRGSIPTGARQVELVSGGSPGRDEVLDGLLLARGMYHLRRRRELEFGEELFSDPAWDILLDLYVAERTGRRVSVSSACIASAAPSTTALRWIGHLQSRGLLRRENDFHDARRTHLRMSAEALTRMETLLSEGRGMLGRRA